MVNINWKLPAPATLKKYGLEEQQWIAMYLNQGGKCACCGNPFWDDEKNEKLRNTYVDHAHVKNYKKLPPQEKRKYVRGIICYQCNFKLLEKSNTLKRLKQGVAYLERFEANLSDS